MSTKKTIQINPELFKMPGQKTLKNKEKKGLALKPVITPNNIKNKLLQRIKEHKNLQYTNKSTIHPTITNDTKNLNDAKNPNNTDEFSSALNYLSSLRKKQTQNAENEKNRGIMHNKTVKHYSNDNITSSNQTAEYSHNANVPHVLLDLPIELQDFSQPTSVEMLKMSYKTDNEIPYGCLKGGVKPSYRSWIQTRKNIEHPELVNLPHIRPPTPPKKNMADAINYNNLNDNNNLNDIVSREQRLEQIKTKLKKIQEQEYTANEKALKDISTNNISTNNIKIDDLPDFEKNQNIMPDIEELIKEREIKLESSIPKTKIKKTIKRTFTLGKSDKLRSVAVLIKNKQTRKNIINTQKDLKKTDITDVRKYLRQHGIIKIGTTCPPDILRKTFESSLMAGEITNTNRDTLIHNFLNEDIIAT